MLPLPSSASSPWTLTLLSVLFLSKLSLVVTIVVSQNAKKNESNGAYKYFPIAPLEDVRTFIENTVHFQIDGDDEEWASFMPGDGLVYLGEDEKKPYTVSMIHQLRCLDIVRKEVLELERNPNGLASRPSPLSDHCVNYMRQMVLCRGDLDFDPVAGTPYPQVFPDSYQCSDWEAVYNAIDANQKSFSAESYGM